MCFCHEYLHTNNTLGTFNISHTPLDFSRSMLAWSNSTFAENWALQADDSAAFLQRASFSLSILYSLSDIWLDISKYTAVTETLAISAEFQCSGSSCVYYHVHACTLQHPQTYYHTCICTSAGVLMPGELQI